MSLVRILAATAAVLALSMGGATAQNWQAEPNYGTINLQAGFTPDPHNVSLRAGGTIDVSQTVNGCRGFITTAPDYDLNYTAGSLPLAISVNSNSDTTLIINAPDGQWYCDDDSGGGVNPSLVFNNPQSGLYDIWVGTYSSGASQPATLSISELYTH